jgi:hypothetical protein
MESVSGSDLGLPGAESTAQKEPSATVKSDTGSNTGKMRKGTDLREATGVNPNRDLREAELFFVGLSPWAYFDRSVINLDCPPFRTFTGVLKDGEWNLVELPEPMASKSRKQIMGRRKRKG